MAVPKKDLTFGKEARNYIMIGAEKLARAVGTTLGPKGRNVSLDGLYSGTIVVHDGVTVAREIRLVDFRENIGATLIREAAQKTNDKSGDGTTTATVLAFEMIKQGNSHIIAGANPMLMKKGIDTAVKQAIELLEEIAEPIKGSIDKLVQVATVSAADEEIGKLIADAYKKVGKYGVVTVERGDELGIKIEYKEGMEWDKGWVHPAFVFRMLDGEPNIRLEAKVEKPLVLITDYTITSVNEILPLLTKLVGSDKKNLFIVCDGLQQEAMALLAENFAKGKINVLPVPAPNYGETKRDALQDLAILTGATFISKEEGRKLSEVEIKDLGQADEAVATQDSTVLIGGKGSKEDIKARVAQIEERLKRADHEIIREKLKERLAKLTSGVAVVKIGTSSDFENRERTERIKDAIGATRAAAEQGIVAGGGVALVNISNKIKLDLPTKEESIGAEIVKQSLLRPIKLLAENAGLNGDVILNEVLKLQEGFGYSLITEKYVDMKKEGIIDPVKVTISALQNAASVAGMILTTEAMVTDHELEVKEEVQE